MLSLHKALLAWLLTGTPPALWDIGYLHRDIIPPITAHVGPYAQLSVAATIESPKGEQWRPNHPTQIQVAAPNSAALPTQPTGNHTSQEISTPRPQGAPPAPLHDPTHTTKLGNIRPHKAYQKKTIKPGGFPPPTSSAKRISIAEAVWLLAETSPAIGNTKPGTNPP
jgi:hypothetical protein